MRAEEIMKIVLDKQSRRKNRKDKRNGFSFINTLEENECPVGFKLFRCIIYITIAEVCARNWSFPK